MPYSVTKKVRCRVGVRLDHFRQVGMDGYVKIDRIAMFVFCLPVLQPIIADMLRSKSNYVFPPAGRIADPQIFRCHFASVFLLFVAHLVTLVESAQPGPFNGGDVHQDVFATVVWLDKSEALCRIEPLHCTYRHVRSPLKQCIT